MITLLDALIISALASALVTLLIYYAREDKKCRHYNYS